MSVRTPEVVNVREQLPFPADKIPEQFSPVLAVTFTDPVGLLTPLTVKLTVTGCEIAEGFGAFAVIVVVLEAFVAATVFMAETGW